MERPIRGPLLAVVLGLACLACATPDGRWAFAITRGAWGSGPPIGDLGPIPEGRTDGGVHDSYSAVPFEASNGADNVFALALVGLILLPVALDVVLLPVTVTHDLVVHAG